MSSRVTELTHMDFQMGIAPSQPRPDRDAWKKMMGEKPVPARLSTLPESKLSRGALATSTVLQICVAAALVMLPVLFPQQMMTKIAYEVVPIAAPRTEVLLPPKQQPVIRAKAEPEPQPDEVPPPQPKHIAKLIVPRSLVPPKVKPVQVASPDLPQINQALAEAKFEEPTPGPARPREPVKTGLMTSGSAAVATVNLPVSKVQTGGFGDPDGLPGDGNNPGRVSINHLGSPVLPTGPGYGNGSGGANGVRGTVASAGFGNGVAIQPPGGSGSGPRGEVKAGGFAAATVGSDVPKAKVTADSSAVQPVTILEKPNPVHTQMRRASWDWKAKSGRSGFSSVRTGTRCPRQQRVGTRIGRGGHYAPRSRFDSSPPLQSGNR